MCVCLLHTEAGKLALTNFMKDQGVSGESNTVMTLVDEDGNQVIRYKCIVNSINAALNAINAVFKDINAVINAD